MRNFIDVSNIVEFNKERNLGELPFYRDQNGWGNGHTFSCRLVSPIPMSKNADGSWRIDVREIGRIITGGKNYWVELHSYTYPPVHEIKIGSCQYKVTSTKIYLGAVGSKVALDTLVKMLNTEYSLKKIAA